MITALLTTLGILLGIVVFFVIIGVGIVEIVKAVINGVRGKGKKTENEIGGK